MTDEKKAKDVKKHILEGLVEKSNRKRRLAFTKYLNQRFGLNIQTAYGKLRRNLIMKWEIKGLDQCVKEYMPEYNGSANDFYTNCLHRGRLKFERYMNESYNMGTKTAFYRFRSGNFSELECYGFGNAYNDFIREQINGVL